MSGINCPYCKSTKVIKHGKTSIGRRRYRCRECTKTWIESSEASKTNDFSKVVTDYLNGSSLRELVQTYNSSPLRINYRIRDFLEGCPRWEDYLDTYIEQREPRMLYLCGIEFSCSADRAINNKMFLALAVDAMSTVIVGFELSPTDNEEVWMRLIDRLNCRNFECDFFMTNGSNQINDAINTIYPDAQIKISYHSNYRDKEINCCLSRLNLSDKLVIDAASIMKRIANDKLINKTGVKDFRQIQKILFNSPETFIERLKYRLENKTKLRLDVIVNGLKKRFEKFHMLKDDPEPVVNGWIANEMLKNTDIGFSRLSLYAQTPSITPFRNFSCGDMPNELNIKVDSTEFRTFLIELAARAMELPTIASKCDMKLEKCQVI